MNLETLVGGGAEVVGPEATLKEVAQSMVKSGVGSVGVVDGHELVGILTERDILRAVIFNRTSAFNSSCKITVLKPIFAK